MDTPLILKIMLSWALMILCFTALFAGSNSANNPNFNNGQGKDDNEEKVTNKAIDPLIENKSGELEDKSQKFEANGSLIPVNKNNTLTPSSASTIPQRTKD